MSNTANPYTGCFSYRIRFIVALFEKIRDWVLNTILQERGAFGKNSFRSALDIRAKCTLIMRFPDLNKKKSSSCHLPKSNKQTKKKEKKLTTTKAHLFTELNGISNTFWCPFTNRS